MTVAASIILAAVFGGIAFVLLDSWQRRESDPAVPTVHAKAAAATNAKRIRFMSFPFSLVNCIARWLQALHQFLARAALATSNTEVTNTFVIAPRALPGNDCLPVVSILCNLLSPWFN